MNIYDYAENKDDEEDFFSRKIDRGVQIKINENESYVIINQLRVNAYSITYSAIKIKTNRKKGKENLFEFKKNCYILLRSFG